MHLLIIDYCNDDATTLANDAKRIYGADAYAMLVRARLTIHDDANSDCERGAYELSALIGAALKIIGA